MRRASMSRTSTINGNTHTKDKVIRREMRLAEGDAFNSFRVKRSRDRIQSLGYFQDKLEIEQKPGSAPDRVVLEANVEEKSTGELQVSAGFSSLERFIVNLSITERNFMGKGQEVRASVDYSTYSKSVEPRLHRALSVRQEHRDRRRHLPARLQLVQLSSTTTATRTYQQIDDRLPDPRSACR